MGEFDFTTCFSFNQFDVYFSPRSDHFSILFRSEYVADGINFADYRVSAALGRTYALYNRYFPCRVICIYTISSTISLRAVPTWLMVETHLT